jgi:2-oxoglutarate dehydrogenase E2 component (dihydrolipoamide succinyltransferase)
MIKVVMPQMGESLAEGTVVRWLKKLGERIERDESLFEISTDKVDTDVPAPAAGVLKEILVPEGQTVAVGALVAMIDPAETDATIAEAAHGPAQPGAASKAAADPESAAREEPGGHFKSAYAPQLVAFRGPAQPAAQTPAPASRTFSPAVLEAARQGGLTFDRLTGIRGSGRGGRITKKDVLRHLASPAAMTAAPARLPRPTGVDVPPEYVYRPGPEDRVVPMSPVRRRIAHHMAWSARISPHATAFGDCDMSRAAALLARAREAFEARVGAPLTYTVLAARAVLAALRDFPALNASVVHEALVLKPRVHLGVAVALADTDELIVPVVRAADELSLAGLARAIADLATRARERRLRPEDVQGGTFTLTNPGVFGGVSGTPILNQPQVGIVGLGAVAKRAVVVNDAIAIRPMMTISLTFDHRALDGMQAFRFLDGVRKALETLDIGES